MQEALHLATKINRHALGPDFAVTELKQEALVVTMQIHETIPHIFLGIVQDHQFLDAVSCDL